MKQTKTKSERRQIFVSKEAHIALKELSAKLDRSMYDVANEIITKRVGEVKNGAMPKTGLTKPANFCAQKARKQNER